MPYRKPDVQYEVIPELAKFRLLKKCEEAVGLYKGILKRIHNGQKNLDPKWHKAVYKFAWKNLQHKSQIFAHLPKGMTLSQKIAKRKAKKHGFKSLRDIIKQKENEQGKQT